MQNDTHDMNRKTGGFTLVEMLVVIAIIAMLAGMILPVLSQARRKGVDAECTSNLKQFGSALELAKTDNNELLPGRLTSLYPSYVDNEKLFLCPADPTKGREGGKPDGDEDPHGTGETWESDIDETVAKGFAFNSSYFYEFSEVECTWDYSSIGTDEEITGDADAKATWSQVKYYQLRHGDDYSRSPAAGEHDFYPEDRFPVIRCFWHTFATNVTRDKIIKNLAFSGRVFESPTYWEKAAFNN